MLSSALISIFPILVAFAGASDLLTMKIPNRVSILLVAGFVVLALVLGLSADQWLEHISGGAVVFVACFVMFSLGWMGGGDAKLASAVALWIGFNQDLLAFALLLSTFGMMLTMGLLAFRSVHLLPAILNRQEWISRLHDSKTGIPYGIAIAAAALYVYPKTHWLSNLV